MSQNSEFDSLSIAVFTGNANAPLAQEITRHLHVPLGRADVDRFSDGEVSVELRENVISAMRARIGGHAPRGLPSRPSWSRT